jgi:predicted ATPase
VHLDRAIAIYRPVEHRRLATRFGLDIGVAALCFRSWALWTIGFPDAALSDAKRALTYGHEVGQAATLMPDITSITHTLCRNDAAAKKQADELIALADEKGVPFWKALGTMLQGWLLVMAGKASDAVPVLTSGITMWQSTGATSSLVPLHLSYLTRAYADLGQFDYARVCIGEAITAMAATGERWCEPELHRIAGEIALQMPEQDAAKAEACFEHALAIARQQQAKSWELRAAISLARLWRDQSKAQEARELLAPVYGWFTEGFETRSEGSQSAAGEVGVLGPTTGYWGAMAVGLP